MADEDLQITVGLDGADRAADEMSSALKKIESDAKKSSSEATKAVERFAKGNEELAGKVKTASTALENNAARMTKLAARSAAPLPGSGVPSVAGWDFSSSAANVSTVPLRDWISAVSAARASRISGSGVPAERPRQAGPSPFFPPCRGRDALVASVAALVASVAALVASVGVATSATLPVASVAALVAAAFAAAGAVVAGWAVHTVREIEKVQQALASYQEEAEKFQDLKSRIEKSRNPEPALSGLSDAKLEDERKRVQGIYWTRQDRTDRARRDYANAQAEALDKKMSGKEAEAFLFPYREETEKAFAREEEARKRLEEIKAEQARRKEEARKQQEEAKASEEKAAAKAEAKAEKEARPIPRGGVEATDEATAEAGREKARREYDVASAKTPMQALLVRKKQAEEDLKSASGTEAVYKAKARLLEIEKQITAERDRQRKKIDDAKNAQEALRWRMEDWQAEKAGPEAVRDLAKKRLEAAKKAPDASTTAGQERIFEAAMALDKANADLADATGTEEAKPLTGRQKWRRAQNAWMKPETADRDKALGYVSEAEFRRKQGWLVSEKSAGAGKENPADGVEKKQQTTNEILADILKTLQ